MQTSAVYTHYDLHTENVLLYEPVKNAYIQYFYHMNNGSVISFCSHYIAKIIDYGRSYYDKQLIPNTQIDANSKNIYKKLCTLDGCKPNCGSTSGYGWFEPNNSLSSQTRNNSHDLRLLQMLVRSGDDFKKPKYQNMCKLVKKVNPEVYELCKKVVYTDIFTTPEITEKGYPTKVNNVIDAFSGLSDLIQTAHCMEVNAREYAEKVKLGEMHIYQNADDLKFITAGK